MFASNARRASRGTLATIIAHCPRREVQAASAPATALHTCETSGIDFGSRHPNFHCGCGSGATARCRVCSSDVCDDTRGRTPGALVEHVLPAPVVEFVVQAALAPVAENVAPAHAVFYTARAPLAERITPAPAVTYTPQSPVAIALLQRLLCLTQRLVQSSVCGATPRHACSFCYRADVHSGKFRQGEDLTCFLMVSSSLSVSTFPLPRSLVPAKLCNCTSPPTCATTISGLRPRNTLFCSRKLL